MACTAFPPACTAFPLYNSGTLPPPYPALPAQALDIHLHLWAGPPSFTTSSNRQHNSHLNLPISLSTSKPTNDPVSRPSVSICLHILHGDRFNSYHKWFSFQQTSTAFHSKEFVALENMMCGCSKPPESTLEVRMLAFGVYWITSHPMTD